MPVLFVLFALFLVILHKKYYVMEGRTVYLKKIFVTEKNKLSTGKKCDIVVLLFESIFIPNAGGYENEKGL